MGLAQSYIIGYSGVPGAPDPRWHVVEDPKHILSSGGRGPPNALRPILPAPRRAPQRMRISITIIVIIISVIIIIII